MDKQSQGQKMVAFLADDPNADEFSCSAPTFDVLCALKAVTDVLDTGIGSLDIDNIQGLAIASRIFSEMLSDRYTGEEVPDPRLRRLRKSRSRGKKVLELVRGGHAEVSHGC